MENGTEEGKSRSVSLFRIPAMESIIIKPIIAIEIEIKLDLTIFWAVLNLMELVRRKFLLSYM